MPESPPLCASGAGGDVWACCPRGPGAHCAGREDPTAAKPVFKGTHRPPADRGTPHNCSSAPGHVHRLAPSSYRQPAQQPGRSFRAPDGPPPRQSRGSGHGPRPPEGAEAAAANIDSPGPGRRLLFQAAAPVLGSLHAGTPGYFPPSLRGTHCSFRRRPLATGPGPK